MSVSDTEGDSVENVIATVQSMIDFTAKHLDGLRTQCATTEEITQRQIRDTEVNINMETLWFYCLCIQPFM